MKSRTGGSSGDAFICTGCGKVFGHGRALYVPEFRTWYHADCFKKAPLPVGTRAFKRSPNAESIARFAEVDAKFLATLAGGKR